MLRSYALLMGAAADKPRTDHEHVRAHEKGDHTVDRAASVTALFDGEQPARKGVRDDQREGEQHRDDAQQKEAAKREVPANCTEMHIACPEHGRQDLHDKVEARRTPHDARDTGRDEPSERPGNRVGREACGSQDDDRAQVARCLRTAEHAHAHCREKDHGGERVEIQAEGNATYQGVVGYVNEHMVFEIDPSIYMRNDAA